jgi:D-alanine-D-alanine ligase
VKKLRVLVIMDPLLVPPDSLEGRTEKEIYSWKTEYDVVTTLRGLGHEVRALGLGDELAPLRVAIAEWKPHIVFNLLEEFQGFSSFDQYIVGYLELLGARYTGCNPRGLALGRDKGLAKKVLVYHRIRLPRFAVFPRGRKVHSPAKLKFPLIVKCLTEHSSLGIAQASVVDREDKLVERVGFVHERLDSDALVEEFIDGREIYVSVVGNRRLQVLPIWELVFENLPPGSAAIATAQVKHNPDAQEKWGINQQPAADLSPNLIQQITRTSKRIYRLLELDGYARLDYRLTAGGELYFLEANPNPEIAEREEFASAALAAGISYPQLVQRIVSLGLNRNTAQA